MANTTTLTMSGYSDDILSFDGIVQEEVGCFGRSVRVTLLMPSGEEVVVTWSCELDGAWRFATASSDATLGEQGFSLKRLPEDFDERKVGYTEELTTPADTHLASVELVEHQR